MSTISEAFFATSVPVIPIAKPTSAFLSAGASFVPSPVTAITPPSYYIPVTRRYLSSGELLASTLNSALTYLNFEISFTFLVIFGLPSSSFSNKLGTSISPPTCSLNYFPVMQANFPLVSASVTIPAFKEIAVAVSILSPVHIIVVIPALLHAAIESLIVSLSGSYKPKIPIASRSCSRISLSASFSKLLC